MVGTPIQFDKHVLIDKTPMPESVPQVKEIGATSAPLLSAAYFIGDRCRSYNDDYMQCKSESNGRGEFECLKEGRKVTRCAASVIDDINTHCLEQFRIHWQCLDNNNHQLWQCRKAERRLNLCVFNSIGLRKVIPDTPKDEVPVHMRQRQIYATYSQEESNWRQLAMEKFLKEKEARASGQGKQADQAAKAS